MRKRIKEERVLLSGFSGLVSSGEMLLVLGPSGSGKTLLLKAIAGRDSDGVAYEGQVLVNGTRRDASHFRHIGFVEATTESLDHMMTVKESLRFFAILGMPKSFSADDRRDRAELVITKLGLAEVADTRISKLSSGERKRLSIAHQLMRDPKILILDEPTSGLDTTSAKVLMAQLHMLAVMDGLAIISCLHQPRAETFDLFTGLVLVAYGRPAYAGSAHKMLHYMRDAGFECRQDRNPAEFLVDLVKDEENALLLIEKAESSNVSVGSAEGTLTIGKRGCEIYSVSWWMEYKTLLGREALHFKRGSQTLIGLIIANIFLALIVAFIWFQIPDDGYQAVQNRIGLIQFFPRDRAITIGMLILISGFVGQVKSERAIRLYRASSYYSAIMTFYAGMELTLDTIYALIIYYIAGLRYAPFTAVLILMGLHLLLLLSIFAIGIIIPFITRSSRTAFVVGMTIWYILALYNGLYVNLDNVSWVLRWISYISPEFFYFTGAVQNEFYGQTLDGESGQYWLEQYALDRVSVMWCAGALMIMNAACILLSYLTIKFRTRPKFVL